MRANTALAQVRESACKLMRKLRWVAAAGIFLLAAPVAETIEMCSPVGMDFMRRANIAEEKIQRACALAHIGAGLLTLDVRRAENQSGYCRVTLTLTNNTVLYLNQLTLTTQLSQFEIFRFSNILPGGKGYAAANSRILLDCGELGEIKIRFHWPISLRIGDRSLGGRQLKRYKPVLRSEFLQWNR